MEEERDLTDQEMAQLTIEDRQKIIGDKMPITGQVFTANLQLMRSNYLNSEKESLKDH